ncbi:MAG: UbiA family prenyltransferase [bacterium]
MKKIIRFFDYIFIARPVLMYPVWIFLLAGSWGAERSDEGGVYLKYRSALLMFTAVTLIMGGAYILNQIQDLETDKINQKFFLLSKEVISIKAAWMEAGSIIFLGVITGFILDKSIGLGLIVLFILAGYLYNFAPAKFKDTPLGGMLVNGIGGYIIYSLGWSMVYEKLIFPIQGISYFFAVLALYINTTLPDIKGDRETNKITFSVKYGIKFSVITALVLEITALLSALYFKDWLLGIPAVLVVPFFIRSYFKKDISMSLQATKFSIAILTVLICIFNLWYIVLVVFVFLMTKLYYYKRFNFNYPSLKSS